MRYWIGVVSKEHVMRGQKAGIAQIGHGKRSGLVRMKTGDWFVYYSPKESFEGTVPLQAFTAIDEIVDDEIWQADEGTFQPWRRKVAYKKAAHDASIRPLLGQLSFTAGKTNWGYGFRCGLIEVTKDDMVMLARDIGVSL